MSNQPEADDSGQQSPPEGSRAGHAAIALAVIVVGVIALALLSPASPIIDTPAVPQAIAAPPANAVTKTPPIPPFYDIAIPPPAAPGTLVKSEPVAGSPAGVASTRFIYHSTDNNDKDQVVSGLFVKPTTAPPAGGFPLITLTHGTTRCV